MNKFLDIVIPRFITENVALIGNDQQGYEVLCCENDLSPEDKYDVMGISRSFNFFGLALFPKVTVEVEMKVGKTYLARKPKCNRLNGMQLKTWIKI